MKNELEMRMRTIEEAKSWLGTPYRQRARLKGIGVDCAQFVASVYKAVGIIPEGESIGLFSRDWFAHAKEEHYLLALMRHSRLIAETTCYRTTRAEPGNVVATRAGQSHRYNHAGIIICWPMIIHAVEPLVEQVNASTHPMWAFREIAILDPWIET